MVLQDTKKLLLCMRNAREGQIIVPVWAMRGSLNLFFHPTGDGVGGSVGGEVADTLSVL